MLQAEWPREHLETVAECPVCGGPQRSLLYEGLTDDNFGCAPGVWALYRCAGCESAYLDPRPTPASISAAYREYYTHQLPRVQRHEEMGALRRLRRSLANGYRNWRFGADEQPANPLGIIAIRLLPLARGKLDRQYRHLPAVGRGARLLDVGCGTADFLEIAQRAGWRASGVDPDPVAVANAAARGIHVRQGGIEAYEAERESFDVITMSHVIEHVHDPRATLEQAKVLLKPGGTLWIETPNIKSLGHRLFARAWHGLDPPRHLALFHWESITRMLSDVGFRDIERLHRHDIYTSFYASSDAIKRGRDPHLGRVLTLRLRLLAKSASVYASLFPDRAELLTLSARKPLMATPP